MYAIRSYYGSLRQALSYPMPEVSKNEAAQVLNQVGLDHLIERLDDIELWSHILSLGEQQRIAFRNNFV